MSDLIGRLELTAEDFRYEGSDKHDSTGRLLIEAACALRAASVGASVGAGNKLVRHRRRGTVYEVIGDAELQFSGGHTLNEGHQLRVYRSTETGKFWCRRVDEFEDGRFADVGAVAGSGWLPIETAPNEGEFLVGLHVWRHDPETREVTDVYEEQHVVAVDEETGEIAADCDRGWRLRDYEFWKPLDPLPEAPATVGAQVGAGADLSKAEA